MRSFLKKLQFVVSILLLITVGAGLIFLGYKYYLLTRKDYPFGVIIDEVWTRYVEFSRENDKYNFGDSFELDGEASINISSEDASSKALTDSDYLKLNKKYKNLSNMSIHYKAIHDMEKNKAYLELNEAIGTKDILKYKYLIEDATGYYYVDNILNKFVNGGNNTYFEMFDKGATIKSNKSYLYTFIKNSLKKNILEEDINSKNCETNIGEQSLKVGEVSLKLDNKMIRKILNGVISDIKKDDRANLIMTSIDSDFSKYKLTDDDVFLEKNESYTINIYTSKFLYKPLKIEIVHLLGNDQDVYSYEGDMDNGIFYYSFNNDMKYNATYVGDSKGAVVEVFDRVQNSVGSIKINKDNNSLNLDVDLKLDNMKYDVEFSNKNLNYKEDESYNKEISLKLKIDEGMVNKLDKNVKINSTIKKGAKVDVDVSDAVLESTLKDEEKEKYDNLRDTIRSILEA